MGMNKNELHWLKIALKAKMCRRRNNRCVCVCVLTWSFKSNICSGSNLAFAASEDCLWSGWWESWRKSSDGQHYSGCMIFVFVTVAILQLIQGLAHFLLVYLSMYIPIVKADKRQQSKGSQIKGSGMFSDHFGQNVEGNAFINSFLISELVMQ